MLIIHCGNRCSDLCSIIVLYFLELGKTEASLKEKKKKNWLEKIKLMGTDNLLRKQQQRKTAKQNKNNNNNKQTNKTTEKHSVYLFEKEAKTGHASSFAHQELLSGDSSSSIPSPVYPDTLGVPRRTRCVCERV